MVKTGQSILYPEKKMTDLGLQVNLVIPLLHLVFKAFGQFGFSGFVFLKPRLQSQLPIC